MMDKSTTITWGEFIDSINPIYKAWVSDKCVVKFSGRELQHIDSMNEAKIAGQSRSQTMHPNNLLQVEWDVTPAATPPTGAPAAGEGVLERPFLAELKLSHHIEFLRKVIEQGSIEEYGILPKELHTAGWLEHSNELSSTLTGNVLVPTEKAYQFIAAQLATLQADNARLADELARARAALEAESMAHDIVLKQLKALQDAYDALGDEFEAQS